MPPRKGCEHASSENDGTAPPQKVRVSFTWCSGMDINPWMGNIQYINIYIYIGILMRDGWPYNIYHVLTMSQMNALVQRRPKKFCSTPMCLWQDVTPFCGLATIFVPDITWVRIFISQATFLCFSAFGWWVSWLEWSGSSRQKESLQHVGDFRDWNQLVMCCKISMYAYSWICTLFIIYIYFFWKCSDSCSLWSFPDSCVSNTPKPVSSGFRQCTVGFKWPAL